MILQKLTDFLLNTCETQYFFRHITPPPSGFHHHNHHHHQQGHAEDFDVLQGRVRLIDQQGNAEADTAADLGRRHQSEMLINAWRSCFRLVVIGILS